jgi:hypothetical protein
VAGTHDSATVPPVTVKMPIRSGGFTAAVEPVVAQASDSRYGSATNAPAPRKNRRRESPDSAIAMHTPATKRFPSAHDQ